MVANINFLCCFATLPGYLLNKHFLNVEQVIRSYGNARANAQCPNCGKLYKYKFNLNRHIRYECGVAKQFRCTECGRSFSQKSSLKSHRGLVPAEKHLFTCPNECGKVYRNASSLRRHLRYECGLNSLYQPQNQPWNFNQNNTATSQGMHACPICNKLFKYKGNMKEHLKIQCGKKKPFRCNICFKDFSYKQNLKTHMGIIHKTLL
ncbi:hypothetical protein V9T40_010893 [Parthenolecanium corni]|uniref:C2H2-type domain-containing protein n=1 Tax=Parthenolecanium corni TaxID=536013 RepID=A0AAN9XXW8_9HEMI